MHHFNQQIPIIIGLVAIATLINSCKPADLARADSNADRRSIPEIECKKLESEDLENEEAESLDCLALAMAPRVEVYLLSGTSKSGILKIDAENNLTLDISGTVQPLDLSAVDRIEPTGEISRESNGKRSRFRGEGNESGVTWNVPIDQFRLTSLNDPPDDVEIVEINITAVFENEDQLYIIRQNYNNKGYIVEKLQPLADGHIAITVKVAELVAD